MDLNTFRRKTAMVLHELEIGIGNLVLEQIPDSNLSDSETNKLKPLTVQDLVEQSYLDDLFQMLIPSSKDTIFREDIIELRNIFIQNEIYNIRNVISHPNRIFDLNYWYKVAALASDPIIELLGLSKVKKSLLSAENNLIVDPPEDWMNSIFKKIPNNIPDKFEHTITGLIGRNKLLADLKELLINRLDRRSLTISLVAPGGNGKTAIVLETLRRIINDPLTKEHFEACIYITLKTEELTDNGIVKLDSITSVNELRKELVSIFNDLFLTDYSDFSELSDIESNKKILLCIDNLETLLIECKSDFDNFLSEIPLSWKVLITSRISIDNSKIIKVDVLKKTEAIALARSYLSKKAGNLRNHTMTDDELDKVVNECYLNPLAIRLTIDLYLKGKDIFTSTKVANKEIVQFSFKNLIDSFDENIIKVLECLYLKPESSRADLKEILDFSDDEIADSIAQLSNTSLIVRVTKDDVENYKLGESILNLLLSNPKNIRVRAEIQKKIGRMKTKINEYQREQAIQGIDKLSFDYINPSLPDSLKILLLDLNKSIKKHNDLSILLDRFSQLEYNFKGHLEFQIAYGRLLFEMRANDMARERFNSAISCCNSSRIAKYYLALIDFYDNEYSNSFKKFLDLYLDNEIKGELREKIIDYMYKSLLYDSKYEEILEFSKKWRESQVRGIEGSFRARAIKNLAEKINIPKDRAKEILRSIHILEDIFRNDGYIKVACIQMKAIADEIAKLLISTKDKREYWNLHESIEFVNFITKHVPNSIDDITYGDCEFLIKFVDYMHHLPNKNPFQNLFWKDFLSKYSTLVLLEELPSENHIEVIVEKIVFYDTGKRASYLFAQSLEKERFFIHYRRMSKASYRLWPSIKEGSRLAIIPDYEGKETGKDALAKDVYIIEL